MYIYTFMNKTVKMAFMHNHKMALPSVSLHNEQQGIEVKVYKLNVLNNGQDI